MEQQQNQASKTNLFDPSIVKKAYRNSEWQAKEDFYVQEVQKINIPQAPNPADIANTANQIESILCLARLDMAFIQQNYESYERCLTIEERRLFVELKLNPPTGYNALKLTVDEMKGIVTNVIKGSPWGSNKNNPNLYDIIIESEKRYIFLRNVIQALIDKKDLLITHSSVVKVEASLNGLGSGSYNHPRNNNESGN